VGAVVSSLETAFDRGRRDYRLASTFKEPEGIPPMPADDADLTPAQAYWIGWMFERGLGLMKARKARDTLTTD